MDANANITLSPNEYITNRVDSQIKWYSDKASSNKSSYHFYKSITIIFGALVPLLIGYSEAVPNLKYLAGLMGAIIAIVEAISSLKKYKDTWTDYRFVSEALTREKLLFQAQIGETLGDPYPFELFVFKCENIMSGENTNWKLMQSNPDKKDKES